MLNGSGWHLTVLFLFTSALIRPCPINNAGNMTTGFFLFWVASAFGPFASSLQLFSTGFFFHFHFNLSSCSSVVFLNGILQSRFLQSVSRCSVCSLKIIACLDLVEALGRKKCLAGLFSREQRLAVNIIVGLKCKCPFLLYNPLQEIELSFTLAIAWVYSTWEFTSSWERIPFSLNQNTSLILDLP